MLAVFKIADPLDVPVPIATQLTQSMQTPTIRPKWECVGHEEEGLRQLQSPRQRLGA